MSDSSLLQPTCQLCSRPIQLPPFEDLDSSSDQDSEIDSIQLPNCTHTFHWSCWTTYESGDPTRRANCPAPNCGSQTLTFPNQPASSSNSTGQGKLLVTLYNEGGVTNLFDLGQALDDEVYYDIHPEAKLARAFRNMIASGDYEAVQEIVESEEWSELGLGVDCLDQREEGTGGLTALELALVRQDERAASLLVGWGAKVPAGLLGN